MPEGGSETVLGYYTLSSYGIDAGDLPANLSKTLPRYPLIPATLLGRLAVDRRHHGRGIGEYLVTDALHRALIQAADIATAAVVVEAIDERAAAFLQAFRVCRLPFDPQSFFSAHENRGAAFQVSSGRWQAGFPTRHLPRSVSHYCRVYVAVSSVGSFAGSGRLWCADRA